MANTQYNISFQFPQQKEHSFPNPIGFLFIKRLKAKTTDQRSLSSDGKLQFNTMKEFSQKISLIKQRISKMKW